MNVCPPPQLCDSVELPFENHVSMKTPSSEQIYNLQRNAKVITFAIDVRKAGLQQLVQTMCAPNDAHRPTAAEVRMALVSGFTRGEMRLCASKSREREKSVPSVIL